MKIAASVCLSVCRRCGQQVGGKCGQTVGLSAHSSLVVVAVVIKLHTVDAKLQTARGRSE